jgi:1-phosphatidylinositol-4-phosphate 5-kinase
MKSVKAENNKMQIFKTNNYQKHGTGGKSGSFFFFTEDKKFIIKSLTKKEKKNLMTMLPNLVSHIEMTNGKSIISRVYGLFKV